MPATTTALKRVFRVNNRDLADPAPDSSPERALELLALADPSLNNAVLETPVAGNGVLAYPLKVNLGNKGCAEVRLLLVVVLLLVAYGCIGAALSHRRRLAAERATQQAELTEPGR